MAVLETRLSNNDYPEEAMTESKLQVLRTIKYSGNKTRLLLAIVWLTNQVVKPGGKILDLMAGTHCVGYALKGKYQIFANDIQKYSYVLGKAYVENGGYAINRNMAERDLLPKILENNKTKEYHLFQNSYADTYFTKSQCVEIDNIRAAIDSIPSPRRELYLATLMTAMCYTSNSTGHFAEYLNKKPSKPKSVQEFFFNKCESISVVPNEYKNKVFNTDYREFICGTNPNLVKITENSNLIYFDPPYSSAQYSRFYHVLETLVRYDYPLLEFKGLYRKDRYFSPFCRKADAQDELNNTLRRCGEICSSFILLSYVDSKSSLIPRNEVEEIIRNHFRYVTKPLNFEVSHSKLGNGVSTKVTEYLILATNLRKRRNIVGRLSF